MRPAPTLVAAYLVFFACLRPGEERPDYDLEVGRADSATLSITVHEGQAAVRDLRDGVLSLWAGAPSFELTIESLGEGELLLIVDNCMPGAELVQNGGWLASKATEHPTHCEFSLELHAGTNQLLVAPPDFASAEPYRFAAMGDIQTAMNTVDEVFDAISAIPDVRFVICTGDIVQDGEAWEYELYQEQLAHLRVPIFATVGNHEVRKPPERWHELFGRFSAHFQFKAVDFTLIDSGNASIDPKAYDRLQTWLDEGRERVHVFGTHFPPFDPIGGRNASFRSRNEGAKLLARLAEANVDLTIYGHIHSFYEYQNAGIPAYVSGGGGALPELYEGIGRHFLAISVDPHAGLGPVEFVAVDGP